MPVNGKCFFLKSFRKDPTCENVARRLVFIFPAIGTYFVAGERNKFIFYNRLKNSEVQVAV